MDPIVTHVEDLEDMLAALAEELTVAKFILGEIPSTSPALSKARDYLNFAGNPMRNPAPGYQKTPNLLRKQAI